MKDPELERLIALMEQCLPILDDMPPPPKFTSEEELRWHKNQETSCKICGDYKHISNFRSYRQATYRHSILYVLHVQKKLRTLHISYVLNVSQ